MIASEQKGYLEVVKALLDVVGIDVDAKDSVGLS